jgi:hypothetical protein
MRNRKIRLSQLYLLFLASVLLILTDFLSRAVINTCQLNQRVLAEQPDLAHQQGLPR